VVTSNQYLVILKQRLVNNKIANKLNEHKVNKREEKRSIRAKNT
jgi:hypothetical protein